jgi:cell division protein FtsW (lipid II flippase)
MFDLLGRLLRVDPAPPISTVAGTAAIALVVVMWRRSWRLARHAITIAHEGGHALVALVSGRRLQGIRLHSDTSGLTVSRGRRSGPGMVLTLAAGYSAPALLGLGGAALLATGRFTLLLWLGILLVALMLLMIRNAYGIFTVLVTGGILFGVSWYADAKWQAVFSYTAVWFLLIGAVRPVFEVQRLRRRRRAGFSDPDQLAGVTGVAGGVWVTVFLVICLGSLAGAALVLGLISATAGTSILGGWT